MRNYRYSSDLIINHITEFSVDNSASILVTLTSASSDEFIGHFGLVIDFTYEGKSYSKKMVMKVKPHGSAISDMLNGLSAMCSNDVHEQYKHIKEETGFYNTHDKEIKVFLHAQSDMFPEVYGYYINKDENVYALLMEYFEDCILLNSVMETEAWDLDKIKIGINAMLDWHIQYTNNTSWYAELYNDSRNEEQIRRLENTWVVLLNNATEKFPELYDVVLTEKLNQGITNFHSLWLKLNDAPKSVAHNDFNPRNSFFKKDSKGQLNICVYDWELAQIHLPMYDLVEFLSFTASTLNETELKNCIENYQLELSKVHEIYSNKELFQEALLCCAYDFGLHRLGMYMMAHSVSPYPFIPHVVKNYKRILNYALKPHNL